MSKILEVNKLCKKYHTINGEVDALCDISFSLNKGEFISIVGNSGCGKSTLLHILAGIIDKSSGSINVNSNHRIGYMLQQDALLPWLSIIDNVTIGLRINNSLNDDERARGVLLLTKYG